MDEWLLTFGKIIVRFIIHRETRADDLHDRVPKRFRDALPPASSLPDISTLIVFNESVIRSTTFIKALKKGGGAIESSTQNIIGVGRNFTDDCRDIATDYGCLLLSDSDFYWTDTSYESIKTFSKTRVDEPLPVHLQQNKEAEQGGAGNPLPAK